MTYLTQMYFICKDQVLDGKISMFAVGDQNETTLMTRQRYDIDMRIRERASKCKPRRPQNGLHESRMRLPPHGSSYSCLTRCIEGRLDKFILH